jgi:hypothetical protein
MEKLCNSLKSVNVHGYNHRWGVVVDLYSKLNTNVHLTNKTIEKLLIFEDELDEWIDSRMSANEVAEDQNVIDELILAKSARENDYMEIYIQRMFNIVKYLYDLGNA